MFEVGSRHLQDRRAKWRQCQPLWNLMTQRTHALRNWTEILASLALAGNHQYQPFALVVGIRTKQISSGWASAKVMP